jgi:GntR family transcriptional regulator
VTTSKSAGIGEMDAGRISAIDRDADSPLYHQLKEILRGQVRSGQLHAGEQLPGEHALCEHYGVSRTVVRQALADLDLENVIERRKGRGTFVSHHRFAQGLVQHLGGLHDDIKAMGRTLRSQVRRFTIELADTEIAERLQIPTHTPVVVLERVRMVDEEPWVFTVSHLPVALAPDLITLDMREQSLYQVLRERYLITLTSSDRAVEARLADAALAKALRIAEGDATLKLTSISYDDEGTPVETFIAFHRADRSRFEVHLTRAQGAPVSSLVHPV